MLNRSVLVWVVMALSPSFLWADSAPQVLGEGQGQNAPKQPQAFMSADGNVKFLSVSYPMCAQCTAC